jgi:molybdopterin converting factor small subunit
VEASIRVKVFVPAFINHDKVDEDGWVILKEGSKMADLYQHLKIPLPLRFSFLYFVNYEKCNWGTILEDGDTITFFMPIAGG